jgi:hypothetical protein
MNKIILTITALLISLILKAQLTTATPYCTPVYPANTTYNMIQDFKIGGTLIQNFGVMGSYGNVTTTFKYFNSTILPTLAKGSDYSFTLDFYSVNDSEPIYFAVWIDFNKNNVFETSEIVMQNNNTINTELPTFGGAVTPVLKTITIPTTATQGATRMRIMRASNDVSIHADYSSTYVLSSCSSTNIGAMGCMYDFNVTIGPALSNSEFEKEVLKIYPNPVTKALFIDHELNNEISNVSIFNQLGQKIKLICSDFINGVDVSELTEGIYFAQINFENQLASKTIKFIKK